MNHYIQPLGLLSDVYGKSLTLLERRRKALPAFINLFKLIAGAIVI